ncbi:MAG: MMPL family transporter [Akkermansiaceae bacterium]|nr:MMPL family transporter [Akkermansiaceae bacterium]
MRSFWRWIFPGLIVLVAAFGLSRTHFNTDVLSVLPGEMPEVRGLRAFQEVFARDEEMVLLLESPDDSHDLAEEAGELAAKLEQAGVASQVKWRPRWTEEPEGLGELFAWLWLNGDPQDMAELEASLAEGRVEEKLAAAMERIATSLDGGEMAISSHDPLGFLNHPALRRLFESASEGGSDGFTSADGRAQLIFVDAPRAVEGYVEAKQWVDEVRAVAAPWADSRQLAVSYTGDPVFEAEIGTAMEGDMSGTLGSTSLLIAVLFLIMQRKPMLLVGMSGVLAMTFVIAMGMAGWIYGELSIMAAGFAAILVGLVVDYGAVICQEAKVCGHDEVAIRRATMKAIGWAAATTAVVFFALNLSGLPGIAQLGTVVACGIAGGAYLMIAWFVPWVAKFGAGREAVSPKSALMPPPRVARVIGFILIAASLGVLLTQGFPGVQFDKSLLRPRNSEAMSAFEKIQAHFPQWGSPAPRVVVEGGTDAEVLDKLEAAREAYDGLAVSWPERIGAVDVPLEWWPSPERMEANRAALERLGRSRERFLAAADEAGFSEEGLGLGRMVLEAAPIVAAWPAGRMPEGDAAAELLGTLMLRHEEGGGKVLGSLEIKNPDSLSMADLALLREAGGEHSVLAGWPLLKPAVLPLVRKDITDVFLPMLALMLVMLGVIFRHPGEVVAVVVSMGVSALLLVAGMKIWGIEWNFLNIAATPLLLGTGIDYGIHIKLALRRSGGDLRHVWHGTGKAVVFCGLSTAIGFGSLSFASIDALASMGKVAVLGILGSMVVSLFVLPGLSTSRAKEA